MLLRQNTEEEVPMIALQKGDCLIVPCPHIYIKQLSYTTCETTHWGHSSKQNLQPPEADILYANMNGLYVTLILCHLPPPTHTHEKTRPLHMSQNEK